MSVQRDEVPYEAPVLVIGATGKQGGATVRALLAAGIPVRALVRDPHSERAQALVEQGASLAVGDLDDPATLAEPCTGVRAIFAVFMPDMAHPERDSERTHARHLVAAALTAGVPHYVQTSVSGAGEHPSAPGWGEGRWHQTYRAGVPAISEYWQSKADVDDLVREAGFPAWTILRPSKFMEMLRRPSVYFEGFSGNRMMAVADVDTAVPLVAVEDIGRAAAAAIADPERFNGVELHLAGDVLTYDQIAATLARAWDEEIEAPELPMSVEEAIAKGMVPPIVQATEWERDTVQTATPETLRSYGVEPLSLEAWASANKST
jgi:uncharacterized protein YbjT (DUF2867 family)